VVFGPPDIVHRSDVSEYWIYGEEGNMHSVKFNFKKINNPFSDNDYSLVKAPLYKENWYITVETWRR